MLIDIHNRLYCVYHGRTETTGDERMVFIDPIDIQPDGKLVVHGPNTDLQKITYKSHQAQTAQHVTVHYSPWFSYTFRA